MGGCTGTQGARVPSSSTTEAAGKPSRVRTRSDPLPSLLPSSRKRWSSAKKAGSSPTDQRGSRRARTASADTISRARLIPHKAVAIDKHYSLDAELGTGSYGRVHKGTKLETGVVRAVKMVLKRTVEEIVQFRKEIKIMKLLDHPNIVKLFETFEDHHTIYLVMELCEGGELFDRIIEAGRFSEQDAATCMQQILRAVVHMHERDISHRDLKPENFLFKTKDPIENNVLKIIDFGLSCHSKPGTVHTQIAGSAQYVAPQVLQRKYDRMCDMWSCGCIMYVLLCGQSPFSGRTEQEVMAKVSSGEFNFKGRNWGHISGDAKDLIRNLLKMDPGRRFSAEQALSHVWVKQRAPRAEPYALQDGFLRKLRCFREKCKLRKAALHIIACHLEDTSPTKSLREIFTALDTNEDGYLCMNELTWGLERGGVQEVPSDLDQIFDGVDFTGTGAIDYTEFLAASLDKTSYLNEDVCRSAFSVFDLDGDGRLSKRELTKVLCAGGSAPEGEECNILHYDGMDFQEFMRLLRSEPLDYASDGPFSSDISEASPEGFSRQASPEGFSRQASPEGFSRKASPADPVKALVDGPAGDDCGREGAISV